MKNIIMYLIGVLLFAGFYAMAQTAPTDPNLTTVKIKITGMDCNRDLEIINDNLKKQKGIISSNTVGKVGAVTSVEIQYNPTLITMDSIYAVVERSPDCDKVGVHPFRVKRQK